MSAHPVWIRRWIVPLAAAALLASCAGSVSLPSEITGAAPADTTPETTAPQTSECVDDDSRLATYPALVSLPQPGAMLADTTMAEIAAEGRLVVGVSGDTLLFGSRDPISTEIEGFDVDVLKEVAKAIFGEDGADRIEYRVITYADRLPRLEAGDVDIVAHTMTINCTRWQRIAFSSVYFFAGQRVLVNVGSGYDSIEEFRPPPDGFGGVVCAPNGSTNIEAMQRDFPDVEVIGKDDISDCLVAMQQGEADAITGDDTVLAGFAAQDPNTEVVGDFFTEEPYGLGFNRDDVDFVQFVNAVLEQMRSDGRLDAIVQRWLIDTDALSEVQPVPAPDYSRALP